jgi:hypothetical protein
MDASKFNIQFGNVSQSQFVTGDYNTVAQHVGLAPEETQQLREAFDGMKAQVAEQAPPEQRAEAVAQATELEKAVVAKEPDPGRVRTALRWFRDHLPQLAGTVAGVLVHPVVGKVVAAAGDAVAAEVRDAIHGDDPPPAG